MNLWGIFKVYVLKSTRGGLRLWISNHSQVMLLLLVPWFTSVFVSKAPGIWQRWFCRCALRDMQWYSSILAWTISRTEDLGGVWSIGSQSQTWLSKWAWAWWESESIMGWMHILGGWGGPSHRHTLKSYSQCDGVRGWGPWEKIWFRWGHECPPLWWD